MKVLSTATRVRAGADGRLTAECCPCGLQLEQVAGADVEQALAAFDQAHPPGQARHLRRLPRGWRPARAVPPA